MSTDNGSSNLIDQKQASNTIDDQKGNNQIFKASNSILTSSTSLLDHTLSLDELKAVHKMFDANRLKQILSSVTTNLHYHVVLCFSVMFEHKIQ